MTLTFDLQLTLTLTLTFNLDFLEKIILFVEMFFLTSHDVKAVRRMSNRL